MTHTSAPADEPPTMNELMTLLGRVERGDLKARLALRELFRALTLAPVRMTFDTLNDVTLTDAQKLEKARDLIAELRAALLAARREVEVSEVCPHGWLLARGCAVCERTPSTDEQGPPESESATLARALVTLADELDRNALAVPPSAERIVAGARAALAATPEGE